MKNEVIKLVNITIEQDVDGFPVNSEMLFECYAEIKSTKRTEYYQAAAVGMNVVSVAVVNYADYREAFINNKKPTQVVYEGINYRIVRTYRVGKSNDIELTLAEVE